jgi:GT2 family glycosyltransferase
MYKDLLIVIVAYRKDFTKSVLLNDINLNDDSIDVLIYDNSPEVQDISRWGFVTYVHDPKNSGVSKAYNLAFDTARELNKKVVLILDQDTNFKLNYLKDYLSCYTRFGDSFIYAPKICDTQKLKIYSPAKLQKFVGKAIPYESFSADDIFDLTGNSVINSGLMIPVSIFEKINGFNENIKLDFSDIYFIEKYKEINPSVILVPIEMEHSLSGDEQPDKNKELHRFKYYCNGAKELARSLHVSTTYTCLRRMLRLMVKYYTIQPLVTYVKYYLGEAKV